MRYRYIAAYKLNGLTLPLESQEKFLLDYPNINGSVIITNDLNAHLLEIDKAAIVGYFMLCGKLNISEKDVFNETITKELNNRREDREKQIGKGAFIIFKCEDELEHDFNDSFRREMFEFDIAIDGIDKSIISNKFKKHIYGILSAFAIGSEQVCSLHKITDGVIFIDQCGKLIYSYSLEMSGSGMLITQLNSELISFVQKNARKLGKDQKLIEPARLLSQGLDEKSDQLQSFLSVWAGLEIFVNKQFKEFEENAFDKMQENEDFSLPIKFILRIKNVMNDKYRLMDKFSLISFTLSPKDSEEDIDLFEKIKNIRDQLMHGNSKIEIDLLPVQDTAKLLRKYLKLKIEKMELNKSFKPTA